MRCPTPRTVPCTCPWPPDFLETLEWQWSERVAPYWSEAAAFARQHGVRVAIDRDQLRAERAEHLHGARIRRLLDGHGIAGIEQHLGRENICSNIEQALARAYREHEDVDAAESPSSELSSLHAVQPRPADLGRGTLAVKRFAS